MIDTLKKWRAEIEMAISDFSALYKQSHESGNYQLAKFYNGCKKDNLAYLKTVNKWIAFEVGYD